MEWLPPPPPQALIPSKQTFASRSSANTLTSHLLRRRTGRMRATSARVAPPPSQLPCESSFAEVGVEAGGTAVNVIVVVANWFTLDGSVNEELANAQVTFGEEVAHCSATVPVSWGVANKPYRLFALLPTDTVVLTVVLPLGMLTAELPATRAKSPIFAFTVSGALVLGPL